MAALGTEIKSRWRERENPDMLDFRYSQLFG